MEIILSKLIDQLNSSVFTLLAILLVAFYAIYRLGGIVTSFTNFKDKHKDLDTTIGGVKDTLASIKATTDLLYQAHLSTLKSNSPLSLSPKGLEISRAIELENKVSDHWEEIKTLIQRTSPSTAYDVQTVAISEANKIFLNIFTEAEQNQMKMHAYRTGINILEIVPIIAILVRDRYLREAGISE